MCAVAEGRVGDALTQEAHLYRTLVKQADTEAHYRACFGMWSEPMQALGRKNADLPANGESVGFFLHAASLLAHVGVLRELLAHRKVNAVVFAMGDEVDGLRAYLNVPCVSLGVDPGKAFLRLRAGLRSHQCGTLVWVSAPLYASYALATRLAERQVYWAMRFHAVTIPEVDRYITQGRRSEKTREYHGERWDCGHCPLSIAPQDIDVNQAERYRMQFGFKHVMGTVAREEKVANPDYLQCVADALQAVPDSLFIWTGKKERPDVREFFAERGLSRRHRFLGWVDPDKCIALMDVFLETFPQGGTMTWLAMAHGVPVVGLKHDQAVFGWLDEIPHGAGCASRYGEYAEHVARILTNRELRAAAVEAGSNIYRSERACIPEDCARIWSLIRG